MYYALKSLTDDSDFIRAEDVTAAHQADDFYCPCLSCKCKLGFRNINSNKRRSCFFKLPSSTHTISCFVPFVSDMKSNIYDYDMEKFSANEMLNEIEKISKGRKSSKENSVFKEDINGIRRTKKITTLRQLYDICASNAPQAELNTSLKVSDIFAGRNTSYIYTKYIKGIHLVECRFLNKYVANTNTLFFGYPYNESAITLKVRFENESDYKRIKSQLWDFNNPVIIYSNWNNLSCIVRSDRQIIPLKS